MELNALLNWLTGLWRSNAGTLTKAERAEIQAIADKYDTIIDVVGSRAAGGGRDIDTNYPVGKNTADSSPTRSDIDFRIDTRHPKVLELIEELRRVGNGAGSASTDHGTNHRKTRRPYIRFVPKSR